LSSELDQLRSEVAAGCGLPAGAVAFIDAETVEGIEAQADGLVKLLGSSGQEPAAQEDLLTTLRAGQAQRKRELAAMFAGRRPQPRDEAGRFASFDGGARPPLPTPSDPEQEHGQAVTALARAARMFGASSL
jgi:hypothetical protein